MPKCRIELLPTTSYLVNSALNLVSGSRRMNISAAAKLNPQLLLNEDQKRIVLASIYEIEGALVSYLKYQEVSSNSDVYLATGTTGIALFFAYLQAAGLGTTAATARDCLAPGVEAVAARPMSASLYGGFPGIAWTLQHVTALLGEASDDIGDNIDVALEPYLTRSPWNHDYDLISGLVSLGVYCLERANFPVAQRCLELIVERLSELAEASGRGLRWHTRPALLTLQQRENYPEGHYNLGLAHGLPGIIALLGR